MSSLIPILLAFLALLASCAPTGTCVQSECQNGPGVMEFADGSIYRGQFVEGEMVHGMLADPEGDIYTGDFADGERNGYGTYTYRETGGEYSGQFRDGDSEGFGKYHFAQGVSGESYVGEFKDNVRHGYGEYNHPDDGRRYIGQMRDNRFEGFGLFERVLKGSVDPFEFRYVGAFKNNQMHGQGIMKWRDGRRFTGEWIEGRMERGVLSYEDPHNSSGDVYIGPLLDDEPRAKGPTFTGTAGVIRANFVAVDFTARAC
jgi:hypothetical protein